MFAGVPAFNCVTVLVAPSETLSVPGFVAENQPNLSVARFRSMAAIEWFGPLIDLSDAASHIGDYVQLLVLVRTFSSHEPIVDATKNWKINEQQELRNCRFISEVICLEQSCRARFDGYIREINLERPDGSWYLVDKKHSTCVNDVIDNLICRGCNYCGIPIESCLSQKKSSLFYCEKSHNHFHEVCWIYRPFQLCVSDDNDDVSLLVKNAAAEILFGNVTAELVKQSLIQLPKLHLENQKPSLSGMQNEGRSPDGDESSPRVTCIENKRINFFKIWLIFLRLLLEHELNSPFRFEVDVSYEEVSECPAFELVSFRMPFRKT